MAFRRSDLQEAFFVAGTHPFRVWGYGTADPLEEVLAPDYFALARGLLRAGELIYVCTRRGSRAEAGEPGMALVMVQADERKAERGGASVRLVQDFGRPNGSPGTPDAPVPLAPDAPAAPPVRRGRGRPPGSRTKKPASLAPAD